MSSYRSPLFGDHQFVISAGGVVIAYSDEAGVFDSSDASSAATSRSSSAAIENAESKSVRDADLTNKQSKKTVQQKIKKAYHDAANLWRTDKKRCALYAALTVGAIVSAIGAIKYGQKKQVGKKIKCVLSAWRRRSK